MDALPSVPRIPLSAAVKLLAQIGDDPFISETARNLIEEDWSILFMPLYREDIGFEHVKIYYQLDLYKWGREQRAAKTIFAALAAANRAVSFGEADGGSDGPIDPIRYDGFWWFHGENEIRFDVKFDKPEENDPRAAEWEHADNQDWEDLLNNRPRARKYRNVRIDRLWFVEWISAQITGFPTGHVSTIEPPKPRRNWKRLEIRALRDKLWPDPAATPPMVKERNEQLRKAFKTKYPSSGVDDRTIARALDN